MNEFSSSKITVMSPAKLTWSLRITGRRDDGYHLLDAEMFTLDLCDEVTIEPEASGLFIEGPFGSGIPTDDRNLIRKALDFIERDARIIVTKNIPHGGGLGGGSANAAAVLRWAGCTTEDDIRRSAAIGADVPFCVVGGRAHVSGIGEVIEPLPYIDRHVTLVIPPLQVSTPAVYRAWDELQLSGRSQDSRSLNDDDPPFNDLELAALVVEPVLATWRDRIREACGTTPTLAGSGATWFVPGAHNDIADALSGAHVIETRSIATT